MLGTHLRAVVAAWTQKARQLQLSTTSSHCCMDTWIREVVRQSHLQSCAAAAAAAATTRIIHLLPHEQHVRCGSACCCYCCCPITADAQQLQLLQLWLCRPWLQRSAAVVHGCAAVFVARQRSCCCSVPLACTSQATSAVSQPKQ